MNKRTNLPLVSVIVTVYNGSKYIAETLTSVINQDYANLEVIVIDDGSDDDTARIVQQFPAKIYYEYQQHEGIASGWNKGVERAGGVYITFIDADDTWSNGKITRQVDYLEKHPETDIVFGFVKEFLSPEIANGQTTAKGPVPGISACTMMMKRSRFMEIGLFNPKWRKGIFSDWYLRATEAGATVYMIKEVFLNRRIHDANHGIVQRDKYVDYVRMLKASLDRKRKS